METEERFWTSIRTYPGGGTEDGDMADWDAGARISGYAKHTEIQGCRVPIIRSSGDTFQKQSPW